MFASWLLKCQKRFCLLFWRHYFNFAIFFLLSTLCTKSFIGGSVFRFYFLLYCSLCAFVQGRRHLDARNFFVLFDSSLSLNYELWHFYVVAFFRRFQISRSYLFCTSFTSIHFNNNCTVPALKRSCTLSGAIELKLWTDFHACWSYSKK